MGCLPVPGDGRYEWDGYFDMDALPEEFNPARGYRRDRERDEPSGRLSDRGATHRLRMDAPWRARRLDEVLEQQPRHTFADSLALQRDYTSLLARRTDQPASGDRQLARGFDVASVGRRADRRTPPPPRCYVVWYYRVS